MLIWDSKCQIFQSNYSYVALCIFKYSIQSAQLPAVLSLLTPAFPAGHWKGEERIIRDHQKWPPVKSLMRMTCPAPQRKLWQKQGQNPFFLEWCSNASTMGPSSSFLQPLALFTALCPASATNKARVLRQRTSSRCRDNLVLVFFWLLSAQLRKQCSFNRVF